MPNGIAVTPASLREISTQMSTGAGEVQTILSRLAAEVAPVRTEWAGAAQAQFNGLWDQLQRDAAGLHFALTGIAKLTANAATAYETAEQSIARSFDEFRVGRDTTSAVVGAITEPAKVVTQAVVDVASPSTQVATVIEDVVADEAGSQANRSKAGTRSRARFATKAARSSETGAVRIETGVARRRERRFKTSDPNLKPGTRLCRLCFTVVTLKTEYIETTDMHVYVCCPHCSGSFPVRHSDVEALTQDQTPLS